jgi:hypothetical protein
MPTSDPWNPNPNNLVREERCSVCNGWGCSECGNGYIETKVEYQPDEKIRCTVWLPSGEFRILFWNDAQIAKFKNLIDQRDHYLRSVRGWNKATYEIRPADVSLFRRHDYT